MHPFFAPIPGAPMMGFGPLGALGVTAFFALFLVFLVWELFWKGLALWHSAKSNQGWWFFAFLFIHTMGILEIVYLFKFRRNKNENLIPFHHDWEKKSAPSESSSAQ